MPEVRLPDKWNEWEIVEQVGMGSFGTVYKAERRLGNNSFFSAIKIIHIPLEEQDTEILSREYKDENSLRLYYKDLVASCIEEIHTMEQLKGNSNIVSIEDCYVEEVQEKIGWNIYIRMEFLQNLAQYIRENRLDEADVIRIGIDICNALEQCEKIKIVHRDIKVDNIFVSSLGCFKLGDFGIARELDRSMSGLSKKGTFSYMAPEMYKGEEYDARVDIYSLGIVLYKLCNHNRLPFISLQKQLITYHDKENALNRRMSGEELPMPVQADEVLSEVILKACAYDRDERYRTAEEFREALERVNAGEDISPKHSQHKHKQTSQPAKIMDGTTEQPGETFEKTVAVRKPVQKQATVSELKKSVPQRKPAKKKRKKFDPLVAAVLIMFVAVCVIIGVFIWMLRANAELQQLKKSVTETVQTAENKQLQETLEKIQAQATEISDKLNDYSWIGSEDQGKISYLKQLDDGNVQLMKVLIYPSMSKDGYYQEYYYWDDELFFAYIWADSHTLSTLKDGEQKVDRYYYDNGKLVRWIDEKNRCHDNETDSDEYKSRGEKYWNLAEEYKNQLHISTESNVES